MKAMLFRYLSLSAVCFALLSSCAKKAEVTQGRYTITYNPSDESKSQAEALLAFLEQSRSNLTHAELFKVDSGYSITLEGNFGAEVSHERAKSITTRMAERFSRTHLNGAYVKMTVMSLIKGKRGIAVQGESNDSAIVKATPIAM